MRKILEISKCLHVGANFDSSELCYDKNLLPIISSYTITHFGISLPSYFNNFCLCFNPPINSVTYFSPVAIFVSKSDLSFLKIFSANSLYILSI